MKKKQKELELELQAKKDILENFGAFKIIGVYWVGNTMRLMIQPPSYLKIFPFPIRFFCEKLIEKYPIIHIKNNGIGIIWGDEDSINNSFYFADTKIFFINIDNLEEELDCIRNLFHQLFAMSKR